MIKNFFLIYNNLPQEFKKKSIIFVIFLVLTTVLEIFGITLIIPILDSLTNNQTSNIKYIHKISELLNFTNFSNILVLSLTILIAIYIIKNLILIFFYFWRNKFIWNAYKIISTIMLKQFVSKSIDFYFKNNSTELINSTYLESRNYISCLNEYLKIVSEGVILIAIFIFLLVFDLTSTIAISLIILISSISISYLTKNKVKSLGETRIVASIGQLKSLQQIFFSIKDIKLKSVEENFINKYNEVIDNYSKSAYKSGTILELPKIFFEIIFIVSISFVIYLLDLNEVTKSSLITTIGIYTVAAFRSLPSVTRIISSVQQINFLKPSIDKVLPNISNYKKEDNSNQYNKLEKINLKKEIKIENISYTYPGKSNPVIKNFSLNIKKGEFIGIIGKSGEGKSTILDLIMGLIFPSTGKILIDGKEINSSIKGWQNNLGYVSQSTNLLDETIKSNIAFGVPENEMENAKLIEAAKKAQIFNFISSLQNNFETEVGERGVTLSGGQIQRIGIARELYRDPEVILLDESTSALDIETEREFLKCLDKLKGDKTIIFVSHRKSALENCDKIIDLENYE